MRAFRLVSLAVVCVVLGPSPTGGAALAAGEITGSRLDRLILEGDLTVVYGDPLDPAAPPRVEYLLQSANGDVWRLDLSQLAGAPPSFSGQRVRGEGVRTAELVARLTSLESVADGPPRMTTPPLSGHQPWATILCRFADITDTPHPIEWYEGLMGSAYPGMDDYWREVSYEQIDLEGSDVFGWYTLPSPRSAYYDGSYIKAVELAEDCTGAADHDVYFPDYMGVDLHLNDPLFGASWGGAVYLERDGQTALYSATWMADWGSQGVQAHEMGHGFGLPHSSGPYGPTYDSRWDVMSSWSQGSFDTVYGPIGEGTIAYHKDRLGWVPSSRIYASGTIGETTLTLHPLGGAMPGSGHLFARLGIRGSDRFYTVEARRKEGYDSYLPGEAVIIHEVDPVRPDGRPAQVVDADDDGDPNDAGAMWTPGETFTDPAAGIEVTVVAAGDDGSFVVDIVSPLGLNVDRTGTGTGTIRSSPAGIDCGTDCSEIFDNGAVVTLTAMPTASSRFTGWSGACAGTGTCRVTMTEPSSVTATFELKTPALRVSRAGSGTGTVTSSPEGVDCGPDCTETYDYGTRVSLTATPAVPAIFTGWSGACGGTGVCRVTMDKARSVTATFITTHTVSPSSIAVEAGKIASGSPASLTADDDVFLDLTSTDRMTKKRASFSATFTGIDNALTTLSVDLRSKASVACSQKIMIRRWVGSDWEVLDARRVGRSEVLAARVSPRGPVDDFVRWTGRVRVRVSCSTRRGRFTLSADLMQLTVG